MSKNELQQVKRSVEDHWNAICKLRQELNGLYEQGEPLTSEKMIRMGIEIDRHGKQLVNLDRRYEYLVLAELPE